MSGIALALIGIYIAASQMYTWNKERQLIRYGVPVTATVHAANGVTVPGKKYPPESSVVLQYTHGDQPYEVKGYLTGREEWIVVGSPIELRLDPNDPTVWTSRLTPTPLARQLIGASLTIPAIAIVLLIAAWMYRRMQRAYANGVLTPAHVVALRSSPIAPRSDAVVCKPADERDKRLFTVYIPHSLIRLQTGDDVNLLIHRDKVLAVMRYEQRG